MAFIDVGSLRAVNMTFKEGKAAGDEYIKAVANAILEVPGGKGKLTLARMGGDEFAIIIDETDSVKVREILVEIQQKVRERGAEARNVFLKQKKHVADSYDGSAEAKAKLREFSCIQQPDISVGATQIGFKDDLKTLGERAEKLAKAMKIETAINFGRDPAKYGSRKKPNERVCPQFLARIREAAQSPSWKKGSYFSGPTDLERLRPMELYPVEEMKRFKSFSIVKYRDEKGRDFYQLEEYYNDPLTRKRLFTSKEIPTRGQTGMLDGSHERSQRLVLEHFRSGPDNFLVMPKLGNLRELNYFAEGMQVGDRVMQIAAEVIENNLRINDLSFKLGGADFLCSLNKISRANVNVIVARMEREFKTDPRIAEILRNQVKALRDEQQRLQSIGDQLEAAAIDAKIKDVENFDFKFKFQTGGRSDFADGATFKDILDSFDAAFAAKATSH
jgi:GGDEF domain-containing protein